MGIKKLVIVALMLPMVALSAQQLDWKRFERMLRNGEYKDVYSQAESIYRESGSSSDRLAAAYWMGQAAEHYQEDAYDSAVARYRALLPELDTLERALCYAFLGSYDSALIYEQVLKRTPAKSIGNYCHTSDRFNITPTAYDVVVTTMQDRTNMKVKERVVWQRRLCAFHQNDNDDIRILHDLRLLEYLNTRPNNTLTADTVQRYINKYRGTKSQYVTRLYHLMADYLYSMGEYVRALDYCDTAIRIAPKSEGGVGCANLRTEITATTIHIDASITAYPGKQTLVRIEYRNADHLWFRLIPYDEDEYGVYNNEKERAIMLKAKPLVEWDIAVPSNNEYRREESLVALPAIKTGHYILLVSPTSDFKKHGFKGFEVCCTDMQLVQSGSQGLLLDRYTGRPIAGQEIKVVKNEYTSDRRNTVPVIKGTTRTDRDGRYRFDIKSNWNTDIVIERDGFTLKTDYIRYDKFDTDWHQHVQVRMDRPIYKPGDTAHAAVVYYVSNGIEAMSAQFFHVRYVLRDPNGEEVLTDSLKTDSYGLASFQFELPKDRLPGTYNLLIYNYNQHKSTIPLRVEEYKQPKFMVTLGNEVVEEIPEFGKPYTVKGMAASYSAVPVSGAKVKYTVKRYKMHRWWWFYGNDYGWNIVAEGETTTAADGSFELSFTPEPDSDVDLSTKPGFEYQISADVTDINGETHPASTTVRVGYTNAFITLDGIEDVRTLEGLKPRLFDLNGNNINGYVNMTIEKLQQPAVPLFNPCNNMEGVHQTMSEADYRKAFPHYAYDADYNNRDKWKSLTPKHTPLSTGRGVGGEAEAGVYRITLSAKGADTVVVYRTVTPDGARKVQSQRLLWSDIDKTTAEVGDTVTLRFGSRFKDVEVNYLLRVGDKERDFRRVHVSDQLKSIGIPVDSAMLGGFDIDLIVVYEGLTWKKKYQVTVPFSHKKLNVEISTFRDRLQPGENEEWTISLTPNPSPSGEGSGMSASVLSTPLSPGRWAGGEASIIMTMYDDALNSYGSAQAWGFTPWRSNSVRPVSFCTFGGGTAYFLKNSECEYYRGERPSPWSLRYVLPGRHIRGIVTMQGNVRKRTGVNAPVLEVGSPESGQYLSSDDIQRMPGTSVESIVAAVGGIGYSDAADVVEEEESLENEPVMSKKSMQGAQVEPQVRMNLNTLAFFVAGLRTDSNGTATYRFTVPELLSRWNVRGLAITKDLKIGTMDKTLVTSKPLMVQPNIPRFLRHGDSISLMAKVVLAEPSSASQTVTVTFLLTDAATGDTITLQHETVQVNDAAQVMFDVAVPQNVYVATYQIVAVAEGMSDGERGQLPVVSNRQAVTVSQALYINGPGEKTFQFPLSTYNSPTAEPRLVAAELTSNPIWLAIKSMPYLKTQENPSTLYLANQLYVNSQGRKLVELVQLEKLERLENPKSRLSINEDVKQTLLQATPWLRDAESEEEQMAAVCNYFDTAALNSELRTLTKELIQRQNADGGWSWMPEGKSSVWTTQQVLKSLVPSVAMLSQQTQSALEYIDKEQQRDYEKYYKPIVARALTSFKPVNIDYLYTRSFYGKAKTEAYKFYYANALKSYKEYENLYTQAQLALIFHRHGDHKAALDLLRRLKQKALESDEMGMYWRDNKSGWWWYQRPIETQALIIQAFAEITPSDTISIGKMQQWLLKQKQTNHWGNDQATTKAIAALLVGRTSPTRETSSTRKTSNTSLTVFGTPLTDEATGAEGYQSQRWTGGALDTLLAEDNDKLVLRKSDRGIAWGAVYYQFTDDMDKIPAGAMGITVNRSYSIFDFTSDQKSAKVGDRMLVSIEITCDRAMDYLELIDGRPSCVEPISTRAGWRWTDGLSYYITVNNTDTRCYIEHIDKGKYVFEYEVYVTNPGTFMAGPVTMQCMYAPEFRAVAPGTRIVVEE